MFETILKYIFFNNIYLKIYIVYPRGAGAQFDHIFKSYGSETILSLTDVIRF